MTNGGIFIPPFLIYFMFFYMFPYLFIIKYFIEICSMCSFGID